MRACGSAEASLWPCAVPGRYSVRIVGTFAVALLMASVGPSSASAQPRKIAGLVVALDRRLEGDAAAASAHLQRLLQNDLGVDALDLTALALGESRAEQEKKASASSAEALALLDEMKEGSALQKATEAVAAYELSDQTRAFPGLLDAIAAQVLAHSALGNKTQAAKELAHLFSLRPDYKLDSRRVAPALAALIEEKRAKAKGAPRVALDIRSAPVAAEVFVDGLFRGVTPLEVAELAQGNHYISLRAPGYDLTQERRWAGLGAPVALVLRPAPRERGLLELIRSLRGTDPPGSGGCGGAIARWAGADDVLVIGLLKKADANWAVASRFSAGGQQLAAEEILVAEPGAIDELARRLLRGPTPTAAATQAPLPPPPPLPSKAAPTAPTTVQTKATKAASSSSRRTWGFVAGGAGVAALGGGIVLGLMASSKAADARNTPQVRQSTYQSSKDSAKGLALGANISYGVAVVGAGVAILLLATADWGAKPAQDAGTATLAEESKRGGAHPPSLGLFPVAGGAVLSVSGGF